MDRTCSTYGITAYILLVGKSVEMRPGGRPRRADNIKTDLKENRIGEYGLDSSG
jgi:hypothetical protein